jgi:mutator protein MutT
MSGKSTIKSSKEFRDFLERQKQKKMSKQEVQVVTAIIMRGDRIFMQQRSAHREIPYHWESPGGKVEPGEDPRDALSRELHEELGVEIPPSAFDEKPQVIHVDSPLLQSKCAISFYIYMADDSFQPKCLDAMGMGWFTVEDILRFRELAPGNRIFFSRWGVSDLEAIALALADFHAATAESEGMMSRTSKSSKTRFYSICKKAAGMLESGTTAPYLKRDYARNKNAIIERLHNAMHILGVGDNE